MRQAFIAPGVVDEAAVVKQASQRDEPTYIHRHSPAAHGDCEAWECYIVEGKSSDGR